MDRADQDSAPGPRPRIADFIEVGPADRVGIVGARRFGLVVTAAAIVNVVVPAFDRLPAFLLPLLGQVVMLIGFALLTTRVTWWAAAATYLAGLATLVSLASFPVYDFTAVATVTAVSSLVTPSLLIAVPGTRMLLIAAFAAAAPVMAAAVVASASSGRAAFVAISVVGGWTALACAGIWVHRSERQAAIGVEQLRRAYAAERRSVEAEAELRHEARTMHDTVLATLTLIAHGGVGVPAETLRAQAAADSALLKLLRTTGPAGPSPAGLPEAAPAGDAPGAETRGTGTRGAGKEGADGAPSRADASAEPRWEALASRHGARGLSVVWRAPAQLDDSAAHLTELAAAVSECLENVRRHSGQSEAEVTLSQDELRTRAVVTDLGRGFVPEEVPAGRLGLAESIRSRVEAVGGTARVFSSPGRGTTVMLEVPRR
ncbi:hypothetical protein NY547_18735 [Cnuibacter physcomitrellae]|uniref:sensor histidine kinase n=1 Tax=Cnuibacter physcomitrellae TaxID=1619308 RepID=UPI0021759FEC|nr:ATP-binding protein [Cnuibacter physcomitrellae]MCS5499285.1 hypothetical protein [Cnuibacter physcomitrellae]